MSEENDKNGELYSMGDDPFGSGEIEERPDMLGDSPNGQEVKALVPLEKEQGVKIEYDDIPDDATCEVEVKYGDRKGEICGLQAVCRVDGILMCGNHRAHAVKNITSLEVRAKDTSAGRITRFDLKRKCKFCFGLKGGGACPYAHEDRETCYFESGKFKLEDVKIEDREDLITLLTGLLNDDLARLDRAKLMEFFEGGLLDNQVDNLSKRVIDLSKEIARLQGILRGGSSGDDGRGSQFKQTFNFNMDDMPDPDGDLPPGSSLEEPIDAVGKDIS